jgi:Spy/CpxP family protein refolding chaperone
MTIRTSTLPKLALATLLAGAAMLPLGSGAVAQNATVTTPAGPATPHRSTPLRSVEGRIGEMKVALKISDAQAPQFERVAQAMRDNAKDLAQFREQERTLRGKPQSALDILAARQHYDALRAAEAQHLLDAFQPLYQSLADEQKKAADTLLAPRPRRPA